MPAPAIKTKKYEAAAIERATAPQSHQSPVAVVDSRPVAVAQRQMQDTTNQSLHVQQAAVLQARIAQSPGSSRLPSEKRWLRPRRCLKKSIKPACPTS